MTENWDLVAYTLGATEGLVPVPAMKRRAWMDATPFAFARRCLPLTVANQAGWVVCTPFDISVRWNGSAAVGSLRIEVGEPTHPAAGFVVDHFGSGVITFGIPWLFRTPPGVVMSVRGTPNFWVDGAHPLDGIVETDWMTATFTMNWRITRPHHWVRFAAGDPVCFLQPLSIDTLERAEPRIAALDDDPDLDAEYRRWLESRRKFNATNDDPRAWERNYFTGKNSVGAPAPEHRTRVHIEPFANAPMDSPASAPAPSTTGTTEDTSKFTEAIPIPAAYPGDARTYRRWAWVADDFFYWSTTALRAAFEQTLAPGHPRDHAVWRVESAGGRLACLTADPASLFSSETRAKFLAALTHWAWDNIGVGSVEIADVAMALPGCFELPASPPSQPGYEFVYSLTEGGFSGGNLLIDGPGSVEVDPAEAQTPPRWGTNEMSPDFNRLCIVDNKTSIRLGEVFGVPDPLRSPVFIRGHIRPGGLRATGSVDYLRAASVLKNATQSWAQDHPECADADACSIGVEITVKRDGSPGSVSVLSAWYADREPGHSDPDTEDAARTFAEGLHFFEGPGTVTFSLPITGLPASGDQFIVEPGVHIAEDSEGAIATTPDGQSHRLGAGSVFILNTIQAGDTLTEIADRAAKEFGLESIPFDQVVIALDKLQSVGLLRKL
ncbi:DUF6065 family protein [Smaragdicoccus niigatensis]|uniref:DUF6065 family protein n=1 Tax=Smaragdicoccus niigatensis TaxID=359359 RepID=UPI0012DE40CD|nr:DUF6065 family protein [Smaragdicoccus niigatensis]